MRQNSTETEHGHDGRVGADPGDLPAVSTDGVSTDGVSTDGVGTDAVSTDPSGIVPTGADPDRGAQQPVLESVPERDEAPRRRRSVAPILLPIALFVVVIAVWETVCRAADVKPFLVPTPSAVLTATVENFGLIVSAFLVTLVESLITFGISVALGIVLAVCLASSRLVELSTYPYVILLQTIPSVATAPLIVIWFGVTTTSVVVIAVIMAFVPVLSNTLIGLRSADKNLRDVFTLLDAGPLQRLVRLQLPSALPYIVSGIRISSTLSVIGAIVGEYITGIGSGNAGLGFLITKSAIRLQTPTLFASGLACAVLGIAFYQIVKVISRIALGSWHESELDTRS